MIDHLIRKARQLRNVDEQEAAQIKRELDEDGDRVYTDPDTPEGVYSVTTILEKGQEDEEGKTGLDYWKENNDGRGDNADWHDILHYKTNRGTLAHYAALNRFDHAYQQGDSMWTEDERESQDEINEKDGDNEYLYSIFKDKGWVESKEAFKKYLDREDGSLQDVLTQDLNWIQEEFDKICRDKNIKASNVEEVEAMFARPASKEHAGFGGQADLMYTDPETGEHVVADLKTSKRVYQKHKYQAAAYAQAAMESPDLNGDYVDRVEIIRMNPENEETEVYEIEDFKDYWGEFAHMTRKAYMHDQQN